MAATVGRQQLTVTVPLLFSAIAVATTSTLTAGWQRGETITLHQQSGNDHACYRTVQNPYVYFGSKTTYGAVAGNDLQTPTGVCLQFLLWYFALDDREWNIHCRFGPKQRWFLKWARITIFFKFFFSERIEFIVVIWNVNYFDESELWIGVC